MGHSHSCIVKHCWVQSLTFYRVSGLYIWSHFTKPVYEACKFTTPSLTNETTSECGVWEPKHTMESLKWHTWGWADGQDAYEKDDLHTEAVEWHAVVLSAVAALCAGEGFGLGWDEWQGAILDEQANIPTGDLLALVEECVQEANRKPPTNTTVCMMFDAWVVWLLVPVVSRFQVWLIMISLF